MTFAAVLEGLRRLVPPYPGLRPFEQHEAHLFFGRDLQIGELVARLEQNRFLAVLGMSGTGKSSLVRAGLLPALDRGSVSDAGRRWRVVVARPAGAPYEALAVSLERAGLPSSALRHSSHGLIEIAQHLEEDESLLVVIDQFEELFRYKEIDSIDDAERMTGAQSDAADFVRLLLESSAHQPPVFVVITMRSDYLGDCAAFRDLPETLNDCQYLVPRLTREQRREAIEGPLGRMQAAPSLVQRMLNDAGDEPDQLPVLQHALMRTWSHWRQADPEGRRRMELQDYLAIGGLDNALDTHADELLASVPADIAAAIFKRLTARGRSSRERRDPATLRELWAVCGAETPAREAQVVAVLDRFRRGDATFLVPREGELHPDTYVDITHESLIRQWRTLRDDWVPAERRSARTFLDLAQRSATWKAKEGELLGGLDLFHALSWERERNRSPAWAQHYAGESDLDRVLEFIDASQADDRTRARKQLMLRVAGPLVLLFVALGAFALYQAFEARRLGTIALARQLTAQSQLMQIDQADVEAAVLLGAEALQRFASADGERVLREALSQLPPNVTRFSQESPVRAAAHSADGQRVLTADEDGIVRIFDAVAPVPVEVSRTDGGIGRSLGFSPDGRQSVLLANDGRSLLLLDVDGDSEPRVLGGAAGSLLAFSADGRYVASGSDHASGPDRGTVAVIEVQSGHTVATIRVDAPILSIALSADGQRLVVGTGVDAPEPLEQVAQPGFVISRVAAQPADSPMAKQALVFDTATGAELSRLRHPEEVRAVAFDSQGGYVATGTQDGIARVLEWANRFEIARLAHRGAVTAIAFSRDGRWVATGSADRTARVFEAASGREVARITHGDAVLSVAFRADSRQVLSGSLDGTARLFGVIGGKEVSRAGQPFHIQSAVFTADGQRLLAGSGHVEAQMMDTATGRTLFAFAPPEELHSVATSAKGEWIAVGGGFFGTTRVFEVDAAEQPARVVAVPSPPAVAVAVSDDGRRLVTVGLDRLARIWDGDKEVAHVADCPADVIALTADGRRLVVANSQHDDGELCVFDLAEAGAAQPGAATLKRLVTPGHRVSAVTISEDGRYVATASHTGNAVGVLDVDTGEHRHYQADDVSAVALDAIGRQVATGSADGRIRVLDVVTGDALAAGLDAGGPVVSLQFVEGGRYVMAASNHNALHGRFDIVVSRHPLRASDLIEDACSRVTRTLTPDEWSRHVGSEVRYRQTCPQRP